MSGGSNGGFDEDGFLYDAYYECDDCDLYLSWPVTPGLAPNADPLQVDMLRMVREHEASHSALPAAPESSTTQREVLAKAIHGAPAQVAWDGKQQRAIADALLREFIVIPRSELPESDRGHEPHGMTSARLWENARMYIARALQQEALEAEPATAEVKRNARRDELARELGEESSALIRDRRDLSEVSLLAIDRIIDLEAQVSA